jgi:hypothetical protein
LVEPAVGAGQIATKEHVMFKRLLGVLVLCLATAATPAMSYACDPVIYCVYKPVVRYETVTTYVTQHVPYTCIETCYDACGRPYTVTRTYYRIVRTPVTTTVAVKVVH